ncbi:MAG: hypothetical protein AAB037_01500 [Chloroflexota bacterium]
MKNLVWGALVAIIVLVLSGSLAAVAGPTNTVPPSTYVRFDFPGVLALTDGQGQLTVEYGDQPRKVNVSQHAGQPINERIQLPFRQGPYLVRYTIGERVALEVQGTFTLLKDGQMGHQLGAVKGEPSLLAFPPGKDAMLITLGNVRGQLLAEAVITGSSQCTFNIGLDRDASGVIDAGEILKLAVPVLDGVARAGTPVWDGVPLTALYTVDLECGGASAFNRGQYDFVQNEGLKVEKSRDPQTVKQFSVTFHREPKAYQSHLRNEAIVPQVEFVEFISQDNKDTVDSLGDPRQPNSTPTATPTPQPVPPGPTITPAAPLPGPEGPEPPAGAWQGLADFMQGKLFIIASVVAILLVLLLVSRSLHHRAEQEIRQQSAGEDVNN